MRGTGGHYRPNLFVAASGKQSRLCPAARYRHISAWAIERLAESENEDHCVLSISSPAPASCDRVGVLCSFRTAHPAVHYPEPQMDHASSTLQIPSPLASTMKGCLPSRRAP